jgi:anthranilate phosphoribosyltransferase
LVFRGDDGMDEVTLTGPTTVYEIAKGGRVKASISPEDFGISRAGIEDLRGGDGAENATRIKAVFAGETGAPRDAILLNSAITLVAYNLNIDSEKSLVERVAEQIQVAAKAIDSGAATDLVAKWSQISNSL